MKKRVQGEIKCKQSSAVNHPAHYNQGGTETIDIIAEVAQNASDGFSGFLVGNIIKYICRYNAKNGVEDLEKARWYLNKLISHTKEVKELLRDIDRYIETGYWPEEMDDGGDTNKRLGGE